MENIGGIICTRKFWWIRDNQGDITLDWEVWFKNKKNHTLLHIIVNNIWKFHWNPFINVEVSNTRKFGQFLDNQGEIIFEWEVWF